MARTLPPLEAFRFFEAAARHLNFTRAAEELHVTHGAVSQRIKHLEEHLGKPLFRRAGRRMLLTDEGRRLLDRVRVAIDQIAEAVDAIRPASFESRLTISTAPCFAAYWLLPRLAEFNEHHPEIQVDLRASLSLADFTRDGVDMAVRFGSGMWPGVTAIKLYDEELFPVSSPAFQNGRLPRTPEDLLHVPLLHDERQPWSMWFEAVGLQYRDNDQGPRYGEHHLRLAAAIGGLGVALARASLVEAELQCGRLARLFRQSVRTRHSYFIVYPPGSEKVGKIRVFRDWLLKQVQRAERKHAADAQSGKGVPVEPSRHVRLRRVAIS